MKFNPRVLIAPLLAMALATPLSVLTAPTAFADEPMGTSNADTHTVQIHLDFGHGDIPLRDGILDLSGGYVYRTDGKADTHGFVGKISTDYRLILGPKPKTPPSGADYTRLPGEDRSTIGVGIAPKFDGEINVGPDSAGKPKIQRLRLDVRPLTALEIQYLFDNPASNFHRWLRESAEAQKKLDEALRQLTRADLDEYDRPAFEEQRDQAKADLERAKKALDTERKTYQATMSMKLGEVGYLHSQDALLGTQENLATIGIEFEFRKSVKVGHVVDVDVCGMVRLAGIGIGEEKTQGIAPQEDPYAVWHPGARLCLSVSNPKMGRITIAGAVDARLWNTGGRGFLDFYDRNTETSIDLSYTRIGGSPMGVYGNYQITDIGRKGEDGDREAETFSVGLRADFF